MKKVLKILSIALAASVMLMSIAQVSRSGDSTTTPPTPLEQMQERLSLTPRANEEAELMALWYSGEITAPTNLYDEFVTELALLRGEWRDSIPALDTVRFWPNSMPSDFMLDHEVAGMDAIRSGISTDWDSLNSLFRATNIDTMGWTEYRHITLMQFQGKVNAESLAVRYARLPLMAGAYTYPISSWTNIYPEKRNDGWVFLLSLDRNRGFFDWLPRADFWYFRKSLTHYDYVGHYYFDGIWNPDSLPSWADDAFPLFCRQHPNLGSPYCPEDSI